jgi:diacylglycerol kinase family enzyme
MGLGFDAELGYRFNQLERRGPLRYAGVTLRSLRDLPMLRCQLTADGQTHTLEAVLIAVANSPQYGNHAVIAPGADVTDGRLDLVAVRPISPFHAGLLLPRLFLGTLTGSSQVFHRQARHLIIERETAGRIHTDGETFHEEARLEVMVHPRSLHVLVAPPAPGVPRPSEHSAEPVSS